MKKFTAVMLAGVLLAAFSPVFANGANEGGGGEKVTLTMGSWRTDDVAQISALLKEYKKVKPNVTIEFKPTINVDYNATLRLQLESGSGPDLMYARSYATGEKLLMDGYFADVSDIPGLKSNFTAGIVLHGLPPTDVTLPSRLMQLYKLSTIIRTYSRRSELRFHRHGKIF